jgi:GTPase SAR1 family protein
MCWFCLRSVDDKLSGKIDRDIKKEAVSHEDEIKLLLLGAGESGKSTIFKQMKIIHQEGYNREELEAFRSIVHSNTIQAIKVLVEACETFGYDLSMYEASVERVTNLPLTSSVSPQMAEEFKRLWGTEAIQKTYSRASEFQLPDSASYFLNALDRISVVSYIPSQQDVLHTRVRTTGIVETFWKMKEVTFRMFDVGGQRNERRKWIHCFDNVTAVIFVAALSEYDQVLFEDETQNRMIEALNLFDQICNSRWFSQTAMILFLNKHDLFQAKIKLVNLSTCFPDYTGDLGDETAALTYISEKFKSLNRHAKRQVYVNITCATDTNNIKFVFEAVRDVVMQTNLTECGF